MNILDIDLDYFLDTVCTEIEEDCRERLPNEYDSFVWSEERVREFLENNLGLSKEHPKKGRVIIGHNEALTFWKELILKGELSIPFEVVHVDSHADLGLGYTSSWKHIIKYLLQYPIKERFEHNRYVDRNGNIREEGIGDYLLFAIAYQWISKITYCTNPNGEKNDYMWETLKDFNENLVWDYPVQNIIQLVYNPDMDCPNYDDHIAKKEKYLRDGIKEPEVPLLIIPTIEDVNFNGEFDYISLAQSPNYTPSSADFIIEIIKEYIEEC